MAIPGPRVTRLALPLPRHGRASVPDVLLVKVRASSWGHVSPDSADSPRGRAGETAQSPDQEAALAMSHDSA
ncbi:hypothetical protein ACCO45_006017 [Purpureocillium lilacinum]|uniref:Uncharacterized protein n=1 Tax=Purpureocillium lilacinum TaxID=33203 RepID=A0ACC4DX14_PURLI